MYFLANHFKYNRVYMSIPNQFSPVAQLCLTLCDPRDFSMPGFPVLHQLSVLAQTHVHQVVIPFNHLILCRPLLLLPLILPASGSFLMSQFFISGGQSIEASASASVLPMNIQGCFSLGLTDLISLMSKGLKSLLQHHSSKISVLQHSAFFIVQLSHMTNGKTIALTRQNFFFNLNLFILIGG